jgi:hypothetical protein
MVAATGRSLELRRINCSVLLAQTAESQDMSTNVGSHVP